MPSHAAWANANVKAAQVDLTTPAAVMARLAEIENDLALRQNALEAAAMSWFVAKREKEHKWAREFLVQSEMGLTVAERKAVADAETAMMGKQNEALYESLKAVVRTLETRANIGMALLKAQGRT